MLRSIAALLASALVVVASGTSALADDTTAAPVVANDDYVTVYEGNTYHSLDILANDTGTDLEFTLSSSTNYAHQHIADGACVPDSGASTSPAGGSGVSISEVGTESDQYVPITSVDVTAAGFGYAQSATCTYRLLSYASVEAEHNPVTGTIHVTVLHYKAPKLKVVKRHGKLYMKVTQTNPASTYSQFQDLVIGVENQRDANKEKDAYRGLRIGHHDYGNLPLGHAFLVKIPKPLWGVKKLHYSTELRLGAQIFFTGNLKNRWYH